MKPISRDQQYDRDSSSIEAQRAAVQNYVDVTPGLVVAEFSESTSGRRNERPELNTTLSFRRILNACRPRVSRRELVRGLWAVTSSFVQLLLARKLRLTLG